MLGSSPLSRGIPSWCPTRPRILRIIPALAGNTAPSRRIRPLSRDHPRSRGEYSSTKSGSLSSQGSSPLSRGIHPAPITVAGINGIIPALAGNTRVICTSGAASRDHPRSRGEYGWTGNLGIHSQGSSPLSRGILHHLRATTLSVRIIPALAGNTATAAPVIASRGGSSPLSRGILDLLEFTFHTGGIIPALAGNTTGRP